MTAERAREKRDCELRIERSRAAVFAAGDGVIPASMTELEREWRRLSRLDADRGWMDLWARVAPTAWLDHKRFRDSDEGLRLDAAVALASDVDGVEAAECAIASLRAALLPWGTSVGARLRFRLFAQDGAHDAEHCTALLAEPLRVAREAAARDGTEAAILAHARQIEAEVHAAAVARLPTRPLLAKDLAHAAYVDSILRATELTDRPNPVTALRALWSTGYVLSTIDATGVTLELPPL